VETRAQTLRRLMTAAKITAPATQTAVVDYVAGASKSRARSCSVGPRRRKSLIEPELRSIPCRAATDDESDASLPLMARISTRLKPINVDAGEALESYDKRVNFLATRAWKRFLFIDWRFKRRRGNFGRNQCVFATEL
jgi:hypothetical protein